MAINPATVNQQTHFASSPGSQGQALNSTAFALGYAAATLRHQRYRADTVAVRHLKRCATSGAMVRHSPVCATRASATRKSPRRRC